MKYRQVMSFPHLVLFLALGSVASASTTRYVDGLSGNDNNNCRSSQTACKTISHVISLAASGDSIVVEPATYHETITIAIGLNIIGSGSNTTIIDGGGVNKVVTISNSRCHRSILDAADVSRLLSTAVVGGLHHRYMRVAT